MKVSEHISLRPFNTFGVDSSCSIFIECPTEDSLRDALHRFKDEPMLVLGGGSNMLFTQDWNGAVLRYTASEITEETRDEESVFLRVDAGTAWDAFVQYAVSLRYFGIENLSLIPGTAGAAPVQNIGAYGQEVRHVIERVRVMNRKTLEVSELENAACRFGYRSSYFKTTAPDTFIVLSVLFRLSLVPKVLISYDAVETEYMRLQQEENDIAAVREAVCSIRRRKLPDPNLYGNAGSFFKNPEVPAEQAAALGKQFPNLKIYPEAVGRVKLSAAQLIELSGWKGRRIGNVGTFPTQPLVIVNYGGASGEEIFLFAMQLRNAVSAATGVELEPEVRVV